MEHYIITAFKLIGIIALVYIVACGITYLHFQLKFYHRSKNLDKFLMDMDCTAYEFLRELQDVYMNNFKNRPEFRGFGAYRLRRALIDRARMDNAEEMFKKKHPFACLDCYSCYKYRTCSFRLQQSCRQCIYWKCCKRHHEGRISICKQYHCIERIPND